MGTIQFPQKFISKTGKNLSNTKETGKKIGEINEIKFNCSIAWEGILKI